MKKLLLSLIFVLVFNSVLLSQNSIYEHMSNRSVLVLADGSAGTGITIVKNVKLCDNVYVRRYFVVTAAHVVDGVGTYDKNTGLSDIGLVKIKFCNLLECSNKELAAKVVYLSDKHDGLDIAVLMIEEAAGMPCILNTEFYFGDKLKLGTEIYHCGNYFGYYTGSVSKGVISFVDRPLQVAPNRTIFFNQTSCNVCPGSSGGGVFLDNGQCIGIVLRASDSHLNFYMRTQTIFEELKKSNMEWILNDDKTDYLDSKLKQKHQFHIREIKEKEVKK